MIICTLCLPGWKFKNIQTCCFFAISERKEAQDFELEQERKRMADEKKMKKQAKKQAQKEKKPVPSPPAKQAKSGKECYCVKFFI